MIIPWGRAHKKNYKKKYYLIVFWSLLIWTSINGYEFYAIRSKQNDLDSSTLNKIKLQICSLGYDVLKHAPPSIHIGPLFSNKYMPCLFIDKFSLSINFEIPSPQKLVIILHVYTNHHNHFSLLRSTKFSLRIDINKIASSQQQVAVSSLQARERRTKAEVKSRLVKPQGKIRKLCF